MIDPLACRLPFAHDAARRRDSSSSTATRSSIARSSRSSRVRSRRAAARTRRRHGASSTSCSASSKRTGRTTSAGCTTRACRSVTSAIPRTRRRARSSPKSSSPTSIAAWSGFAPSSTRTTFQFSRYRAMKPTTSSARSRAGRRRGRQRRRRLGRQGLSAARPARRLAAESRTRRRRRRSRSNGSSVENGSERLGVPPERVTDYLALVGDTSDNVPGREGHRRKDGAGAGQRVRRRSTNILAHAAELTKKRPREALLEHGGLALLSQGARHDSRRSADRRSTSTAMRLRRPTTRAPPRALRRARVPHARPQPPGRR